MSAAAQIWPAPACASRPSRAPTGRSLVRRLMKQPHAVHYCDVEVVPIGARPVLDTLANLVARSGADLVYRPDLSVVPGGLARVVAVTMQAVGAEQEIDGHLKALARARLIVIEGNAVRLALPQASDAPGAVTVVSRSPGRRAGWMTDAQWAELKAHHKRAWEAQESLRAVMSGQTAMMMVIPGGAAAEMADIGGDISNDISDDISAPDIDAAGGGISERISERISPLAHVAAAAAYSGNGIQNPDIAAAAAAAREAADISAPRDISAAADISAVPDISAARDISARADISTEAVGVRDPSPAAAAIADRVRARFGVKEPAGKSARIVQAWITAGADAAAIDAAIEAVSGRPNLPPVIGTVNYLTPAVAEATQAAGSVPSGGAAWTGRPGVPAPALRGAARYAASVAEAMKAMDLGQEDAAVTPQRRVSS